MKSNIKLSILAVLICLANRGYAQVISLDSVLAVIDRQNPMLQEYDNKVKALHEYSAGAKSWMAPMVGAGTFMTPYPNQMLMDERDEGSVMFSFEQEIPNPAKLNANGTVTRLKNASLIDLNARYRDTKMISNTTGTTIRSVSWPRIRFSYWPLHSR